MNYNGILKFIKKYGTKYAPEILIGFGMMSIIKSQIESIKVTPVANNEIKKIQNSNSENKRKIIDTSKVVFKYYGKPIFLTSMSFILILKANSININRYTAITAAYKLSEKTLDNYKESIHEIVGTKKEKEIKDNIAKNIVENNTDTYIHVNRGTTLCMDSISGRYFMSEMENLKEAVNDFNAILLTDSSASLNDFYDLLGLNQTSIGEELGWYYYGEFNGKRDLLNVSYSTQLTKEGKPCIVILYDKLPKFFVSNSYM